MNKCKVHINCSPYEEDGKWHITVEDDYEVTEVDARTALSFELENLLEELLDGYHVHSYYIERPGKEPPVVHSN